MACFPRFISFSVLFPLVAQLACGVGFVQTRKPPSDLFNGAGFNSMNAAVVGREGSEVWDAFSRRETAARLGVCRTRALVFNDRGVNTERVLQGLVLVISEARKNRVRLILSLGPPNLRWPTKLNDDAFVNSGFKKQVKRVLRRINTVTGFAYRDDPAIMGWELISLQPQGCQVDLHFGKTLNGWIHDMASFVKSIDGNHLLTVGVEEFHGDSNMLKKKAINPRYDIQVVTDFISNHLFIKEIDFITVHMYADVWLKSGEDDSKRMYGGGQNFEHFPNIHRVLQRRFLHLEESPPPSLVVVSHVKAAVPPSQPSGCTNIPTNEDGHCPHE